MPGHDSPLQSEMLQGRLDMLVPQGHTTGSILKPAVE
jgi:hypothetical protein